MADENITTNVQDDPTPTPTGVKDLLCNTLITEFGYEVILQGSMPEDEAYPESFFTFFNNDTTGDQYFDNVENVTIWDFDLNFYSSDPTKVNTTLIEAKSKLQAVGFTIDGKGYDVLSDEPTHTGRGINVLYIEKEEINYD